MPNMTEATQATASPDFANKNTENLQVVYIQHLGA